MKVLRTLKTERQDRLISRFKREFYIAQKLDHPNVVKVFSLEDFAGLNYMLIEFIQGKSLQKIIDESGAISQDLAIKLMRYTLMALAHCHQQGVIHRDVKPSNIMVTPENQAKLFDFGLAFVVGEKRGRFKNHRGQRIHRRHHGLYRTGTILQLRRYRWQSRPLWLGLHFLSCLDRKTTLPRIGKERQNQSSTQ